MTLIRESKVRITSTAPPLMVRATGWCEDCGDVEVKPMCVSSNDPTCTASAHRIPRVTCCPYADCPQCGNDVDQWAWA